VAGEGVEGDQRRGEDVRRGPGLLALLRLLGREPGRAERVALMGGDREPDEAGAEIGDARLKWGAPPRKTLVGLIAWWKTWRMWAASRPRASDLSMPLTSAVESGRRATSCAIEGSWTNAVALKGAPLDGS
jgi:hypothetical protein